MRLNMSECPNININLKKCNCTYPCNIKGKCCECIRNHRMHRELPACFFPPEVDEPFGKSEEGFLMGLSLGAVSIDNQLYNQIGLRPEFSLGKFGVALDLTVYIDDDGKIYKDNWDSADDIIEKFIMYAGPEKEIHFMQR